LYTITFYSFKGGVGRTMALVNVAAEMARCGRQVLVVDFDLEAPGLETYKHLRPEKPQQGIVEFVTEYRRTGEVPDLRNFVYETKKIGKKGGRLWVMPAGRRDPAYHAALASLDWQRLYREEDGFLLFEDTKKGWEVELKPDYVLIDSRTGDTDVLGICTRQLPDAVVLMFTPNEQNLVGLESVCRSIRREETEGLKKKIHLHFVAANVPDLDDEYGILRRQIKAFKERLNFKHLSGTIRRYESFTLLDQSIFTLDRRHSRLARSYRRLLERLRSENAEYPFDNPWLEARLWEILTTAPEFAEFADLPEETREFAFAQLKNIIRSEGDSEEVILGGPWRPDVVAEVCRRTLAKVNGTSPALKVHQPEAEQVKDG
jgi:MinD-like ATPase involved in chromosome partitioning or flagellar assembly